MDHSEFGMYLAQQRELRGMSRDEVARITRIPPSLLQALETGQHERLPERIFVVNYIRSYAQVIGLAPDEAVLRYEEIYTGSQTVLAPAELERRRRRQAWRTLALLSLAAAAAGAAVWWFGASPGGG
ncbi:MAG: helix-turn-helix transcriptional regulator [Myxococcaceae bacterium]